MSRLISWFLEWELEGSRYPPFTAIRSIARGLDIAENALCSGFNLNLRCLWNVQEATENKT